MLIQVTEEFQICTIDIFELKLNNNISSELVLWKYSRPHSNFVRYFQLSTKI